MTRRRVAVVGGGITGLAAAHKLVEGARGRDLDVVLLEAGPDVGGTVRTEHTGGFTIEGGADAFITDKPWARALCERLGIADRLIGTNETERRTFVVHDGRLHPLPEGFLMLAPTNPWAMVGSSLFSWRGKLRMALDLVLPRRQGGDDETLASFVRRRLGREALERAADPLVGGIYTADPERLSLAATMPRFLEMERQHRSLILGLRAAGRAAPAARTAAGARYALFAAHQRGMGGLVADLAQRLPEGVVRTRAAVEGLARDGRGWRLRAGGEALDVDAIVLTIPAPAAARLLEPVDATVAAALGAIDYASSATVTLAFRSADLPAALPGFGFVVPAIERRTLLACTFASRKFAGRAPDGHDLIRAFVGGARRPDLAVLPDDVLLTTVRNELRGLLGITASPVLTRVHRHPQAMPQYALGHLDRVADIERRVAALPGLRLAGAAYRGVGIPDCVRGGEEAADAVIADPRLRLGSG